MRVIPNPAFAGLLNSHVLGRCRTCLHQEVGDPLGQIVHLALQINLQCLVVLSRKPSSPQFESGRGVIRLGPGASLGLGAPLTTEGVCAALTSCDASAWIRSESGRCDAVLIHYWGPLSN